MSLAVLRCLATAGASSAAVRAAPPTTALRRKSARVPPASLFKRLDDGAIFINLFEGDAGHGFDLPSPYVVDYSRNPVSFIAASV